MVQNSQSVLPLSCSRCFHMQHLILWVKCNKGYQTPEQYGAFSSLFSLDEKSFLTNYRRHHLLLPLSLQSQCASCLLFYFFPSSPLNLILSPSDGSLLQYVLFPHLSVNEADEYSWKWGWHEKMRLSGDGVVDDCVRGDCGGHQSEGSLELWVDITRLCVPLLMMQMCIPEFWFGRWWWFTRSQGLTSLSGGCWSLCLAPSRQCGTGTQHKTWKRNYRSALPPLPLCGPGMWQKYAVVMTG